MSDKSEVVKILAETRDHPGRELYRDWTELQWTLAVLHSHYDALLNTTAQLSNAMNTEQRARQKVIGDIEVDVIRSFQGYFSCAYTLYEQAQYLKNNYLCLDPENENNCSCEKCSRILEELHETDMLPRWGFIQRLRAYFQHRRSPTIIQVREGSRPAGNDHLLEVDESGEILLKPEAFIKFEESGGAVDHVKRRGEINLLKETQAFHRSVYNYYGWFHDYLRASNQDIVVDWDQLVKGLKEGFGNSPAGQNSGEHSKALHNSDLSMNQVRKLLESLRNGGHQFSAVIENFPESTATETFPTLTNEEVKVAKVLLNGNSAP